MDSKKKRELILDNYQNPSNREFQKTIVTKCKIQEMNLVLTILMSQ